MCALGHLRTNVAETDDAKGLAPNFGADELCPRPLAALHRGVRLGYPTGEGEEQRDRVLRGGNDVSARRVDDLHALASGGPDIDLVHAGARAAANADLAARLGVLRGHPGLAPSDQLI